MPTSFNQRLTFKNIPEKLEEEFKFTGGLDTDTHETKQELSKSPNLLNVLFNDTASIKTRNGYIRYNTLPVGAASDQANTGAQAGNNSITNNLGIMAQTFQPSGAISVTQVDLYLSMVTSGEEQYVKVELWTTSGGAPASKISTGDGQILLISGTSETTYSFRFRRPVSLSASTTYAIVIKPYLRSSSQAVSAFRAYYRTSSYANGSYYASTDGGMNWTNTATQDLKFIVYGGGNTPVTGLIRYYNNAGVKQLLAKVGTSLYRGNDGTGAMTAINMANGNAFGSADYLDSVVVNDTLLVVGRSSSQIVKYRGSTNAPYLTGTITVTNGSATVTGSGTSWSTATNAEVGEYIQLPDDKWYKITGINSNTSLTIEVSYLGTTLSGESYVISPWGAVQGRFSNGTTSEPVASLIRPTPFSIEYHINRVWTYETGNTLRFSALDTSISGEAFNDFDTGNNAGTIIVPTDTGDVGTGIYSNNGYLYVFQTNSIWEVFGNSPANFELRNISNEVGMIDKRTLVEYERDLIFFSGRDIYLFDGANPINLTGGRIHNLIEDEFANFTSCSATLWGSKYILSFTSSGNTYNDKAIYIDLVRNVYGLCDATFANVWSTWNGTGDNRDVYFGSSNQGTIYKWDTGAHDDGYAIHTLYDTPSMPFGSGMNDKSLKKYYVQQLSKGDYDMTVTMFTDITREQTTANINLSGGSSSLWGVMVWGVDTWADDTSIITTRVDTFQNQGKYFKWRFEDETYGGGLEILGMTSSSRVRRLQ
jgi:hypothetical protein